MRTSQEVNAKLTALIAQRDALQSGLNSGLHSAASAAHLQRVDLRELNANIDLLRWVLRS